jgi:hypothetical protein
VVALLPGQADGVHHVEHVVVDLLDRTDLRDEQIIVGLVAPGAADTALRRQLQGNTPAPTAADSAAAMIKVIDGLTLENSAQPTIVLFPRPLVMRGGDCGSVAKSRGASRIASLA